MCSPREHRERQRGKHRESPGKKQGEWEVARTGTVPSESQGQSGSVLQHRPAAAGSRRELSGDWLLGVGKNLSSKTLPSPKENHFQIQEQEGGEKERTCFSEMMVPLNWLSLRGG